MARLPGTIAGLPVSDADRSRQRDRFNPWRAWYKTAEWQKLRWRILARDLFTCQMCGCLGSDTSRLVADHRTPHRGDATLFWDEANLWTLCKTPCHDSVKQREENAARRAP
jgi:5-methylcytosine-specific restriction endonuclease McrA